MESKLKTLKVADLRDILAKAQQPSPPTKAAKADLVARILASKEATDVYNAKFGPKDDLLAPPEEYVCAFSVCARSNHPPASTGTSTRSIPLRRPPNNP